MVLHLGGEKTVSEKNIVAIFDAESLSEDLFVGAFDTPQEVFVKSVGYKSIILAVEKGKTKIYYSPISAATLHKRSEHVEGHCERIERN